MSLEMPSGIGDAMGPVLHILPSGNFGGKVWFSASAITHESNWANRSRKRFQDLSKENSTEKHWSNMKQLRCNWDAEYVDMIWYAIWESTSQEMMRKQRNMENWNLQNLSEHAEKLCLACAAHTCQINPDHVRMHADLCRILNIPTRMN